MSEPANNTGDSMAKKLFSIPATAEDSARQQERSAAKRPSWLAWANILLRRVHLYAGLFLLPWVLLYGITGAMYNHQGLFPEVSVRQIAASDLTDSALTYMPDAETLARRVVEAMQSAAPQSSISLSSRHGAEFNNDIILQVEADGRSHAVHIDPVSHAAKVVRLPKPETLQPAVIGLDHVTLTENPYELARQSVPDIMTMAGISSSEQPRPRGWCKLNFLADVDGAPARVTYVLRDGHVDVTRFEGQDGMTLRQFFMRLHTTHGQPPHWNGRMYWSLLLDTMAIAMVTWGITGLVMWWQIKRTRIVGAIVIASSILTAGWLYYSMVQFYATTKL